MFRFQFLKATVVFELKFIQNTVEACLKIKSGFVDVEIWGWIPVGGQNRPGRSGESMV